LPTSIQPFVIICLESALEAGELDTRLVQLLTLSGALCSITN